MMKFKKISLHPPILKRHRVPRPRQPRSRRRPKPPRPSPRPSPRSSPKTSPRSFARSFARSYARSYAKPLANPLAYPLGRRCAGRWGDSPYRDLPDVCACLHPYLGSSIDLFDIQKCRSSCGNCRQPIKSLWKLCKTSANHVACCLCGSTDYHVLCWKSEVERLQLKKNAHDQSVLFAASRKTSC